MATAHMDEITACLQKIFKLPELPDDQEWAELTTIASIRTFKKNETILKSVRYCEEVIFVVEGMLASAFSIKEKTVIGRFFTPGCLCTNFDSLLTQTPSKFQIISVTACVVISIPAAKFLQYYYHGQRLGVLVRKSVLEIMAEDIWLTDMKLLYSKEEMVHVMREHYPDIIKDVPYRYMAMFLGITPEAYSRVLRKSQRKS
jgi:CRP-like cAMP-binding protein